MSTELSQGLVQTHTKLRSLSRLSNHELLQQLQRLNQQKQRLDAELLLNLSELDQRRLYREQACSSAFEFCVSRLGYSEDVAWKRVGAARMLRQFPLVYQLLAEGRIHLSALMLLRPHLTSENHEEWLLLACEKSKRQVEKFVASRCPQPDKATSIRKLPTAGTSPDATLDRPTAAQLAPAATLAQNVNITPDAAEKPAAATTSDVLETTATPTRENTATPLFKEASKPQAASMVAPLSSSTYRVTFTASDALKQKLDRARELLSHCIQPSNLPALLERALDQLIEREERRRYGVAAKACKQAKRQHGEASCEPKQEARQFASSSSGVAQDPDPTFADAGSLDASIRMGGAPEIETSAPKVETIGAPVGKLSKRARPAVAAAVRREVWERDGEQCTFIDQSGRRCCQRHFLELDHIEPYAIGGAAIASNLRLRCRSHNALEAQKVFGRRHIDGAIAHTKRQRRSVRLASVEVVVADRPDCMSTISQDWARCAQSDVSMTQSSTWAGDGSPSRPHTFAPSRRMCPTPSATCP